MYNIFFLFQRTIFYFIITSDNLLIFIVQNKCTSIKQSSKYKQTVVNNKKKKIGIKKAEN